MRGVVLFASLVLLVPSVVATPVHTDDRARELRAAWDAFFAVATGLGADFGDGEASQNVTAASGKTLELFRLGDADGDGADDVLAFLQANDPGSDPEATTGHVQALSGRDLSRVLWSQDLVGAGAYPTGDTDGDGVGDFEYTEVGPAQVTSTPTSIGYAEAGQRAYEYPVHQEIRSGIDGRSILGRDSAIQYESTEAYASGIVAGASIDHGTFTVDALLPLGESTYAGLQASYASGYDYAYVPAASLFAYGGPTQLSVQALDEAGQATGTVGATGTFDNVVYASLGNLDADAGLDVVVLVEEDLAPYRVSMPFVSLALEGQAAPVRVEAWGTAQATKIWTRTFDRQAGYLRSTAAIPIGDLDGDGFDEVEFIDAWMPTPLSISEHFEILSGKDGATLASKQFTDELFVVMPFGDVDADGKEEVLTEGLKVGLLGAATSEIVLGIAGLDLAPRWTIPVPLDSPTYVLNFNDQALGDDEPAFADWTGDGAPDLVLADDGPNYHFFGEPTTNLTVEVTSGATGEVVWQTAFHDVWSWSVLDDVTGSGSQDMFVAVASGVEGERDDLSLRNATLTGQLVAGETGRPDVTFVLRGPEEAAAYSAYSAKTLGNLDGEGGPEWTLRIMDLPENPYSGTQDNDPVVRWLVFAGTPGAPAQLVQAGAGGDGDLDPMVDVDVADDLEIQGAGAGRPVQEEAVKSTPGLAALWVLAALAGLGAARRSRRA